MKKILVATDKPFAKVALEGIRKIVQDSGNELLLLENYKSKQELLEAVGAANAIIVRSDIIDKEVIDASSGLQIVVRAGAGFDNIDLQASRDKGIVVMNTPGQNSNAVAELAFGMMVFHARKFFSGKSGSELKDKSIGIHAYGFVGRRVGEIAKGFGMKVFAFDPFIPASKMKDDGVTPLNSVEELYKSCQYISLHIPATAETKKSIDYKLLSTMPAGATLVNTARKEVICEDSLLRIYADRADFSYLSDVAPDCLPELVEKYDGRFYCTPKKMGAQTEEANINAGLAAARQIVAFFKDGNITFKVN